MALSLGKGVYHTVSKLIVSSGREGWRVGCNCDRIPWEILASPHHRVNGIRKLRGGCRAPRGSGGREGLCQTKMVVGASQAERMTGAGARCGKGCTGCLGNGKAKGTCAAGAQGTAETAGGTKLGSQACASRRARCPGEARVLRRAAVEGRGPGDPAPQPRSLPARPGFQGAGVVLLLHGPRPAPADAAPPVGHPHPQIKSHGELGLQHGKLRF